MFRFSIHRRGAEITERNAPLSSASSASLRFKMKSSNLHKYTIQEATAQTAKVYWDLQTRNPEHTTRNLNLYVIYLDSSPFR
jgi:hypothetical protein